MIGQHQTFREGARIWQDMEDCIMKEEISVTLLNQVKKWEDEISFILAWLCCPTCKDGDRERWRSNFLSKINKLVETEKSFRDKLDLLETAFMFAGKVLSSPGHIPKDIINRKDSLRNTKMKELNEGFWGQYRPLLKELIHLQLAMKSVSFMNITKDYLQKYEQLKCVTVQGNMDNLLLLFKFLSNDGISKFETEWNGVLLNAGLHTVDGIKAFLGQLNTEQLQEEFSILEEYVQRKLSPDVKIYITDCMKFSRILEKVKHIILFLEEFKIQIPKESDLVKLEDFLETFEYDDEIVLENLHEPLTRVEKIISPFDEEEIDEVIVELGESSELINFLKEVVNEDIRILIDAVEEHSDQSISVPLVSDLIQVHGFLAPVITKCVNSPDPSTVLMTLVDECKKHPMISPKITHCSTNVYSLKGLYQNVANREEMTREIIMNCLNKGTFDISLDDNGTCQITMCYKKDEMKETRKSMSELQDLRSRAHLIMNSNKKNHGQPNQEIDYTGFIEQVNLLCDIEDTIVKLQSSGYIKYYNTRQQLTITETEELKVFNSILYEELVEWEESLYRARQEHYFLNYYWSDQLCVLYNFFTNPEPNQVNLEVVCTLIHFVDPTIDKEKVREYRKNHHKIHPDSPQDNPSEILSIIGKALGEIFMQTRPRLRNIVDDMNPIFEKVECTGSVRKGELYVVALDEQSALTVNVMMSLYENTTNGYPEPYQVIFCGPHTTWEELKIFLHRCFTQTTYLARESLFCLANAELLTNEVQFELVDFIKKQDTEDSDFDCQLAIICRGGDHHHIVEEFSKFSHRINGMTNFEISQRFRNTWSDVKVVTSTLPGLGKTEFVRKEAQKKRMNVVTFPISGQFAQCKIIKRLKQLDLRRYECLHFDIGEVNDPVLVETFLFQLIVTGMVSFGTQIYRLSNTHVYIEIANSLNDQLCESLPVIQSFTSDQLQWNNYDNLEVSSKITSDIQVVCQYLNSLDQSRLESTDIHFSGGKIKPLSANRCRELLLKYYSSNERNEDTTFTALNTFLGLLAGQLRKFSRSAFFEIENLKLMLEENASGVRRNLLMALLDVSKDFAARSLKTCTVSHHQQTPLATSAERMVQRVEGMIRWEESNHLLIVFQGVDSQTISAFYRDKDRVPQNVSELLKSQIVKGRSKELDDFKKMTHKELHEKLEKIARSKSVVQGEGETVEFSGYALTPDNMLKMILIILRVRANVPIIIMGETGCGKTSLVEYLARICEIPFAIYNFHAGRTEEEVKTFIEKENNEAKKTTGQRWVFLDEINTCHHLGMINEIMCHHTLYGRPLSKKLILLAACNPYKLRPKKNSTTAGLEGKNINDDYSKLVYRVHPLPEAMADYVWDYGSLTPEDEKAYIHRMVQNIPLQQQFVLVNLLAESQKFIRDSENNPFCVSLRDVRRCIILIEWFMRMMNNRDSERRTARDFPQHLKEYQRLSHPYDTQPVVKSIVLALAHCYLSRLQTESLRIKYTEKITNLFPSVPSKGIFSAIIRMEQEDYLHRMELPPGTARNAALRENVFVMLVSILNRIPVFVVGKPGCSKSLAIQLIKSNLRGKDSKDPLFKKLPQLYVVSYQGSESSTSEGINEIFKLASRYKSHNKDANVLPVVLLDEVGLAENSPNNPLKVLHSILEPGKGELPNVAVVGISNWALDAAKMNRAIHLSRPEPTVKDLEETAISLYQANIEAKKERNEDMDHHTLSVLNCLASAYHEYQAKQGHANFHGLRDYYSLVKSLRADSCNDMNQISIALQRNFGGIAAESSIVQQTFVSKLTQYAQPRGKSAIIPATTLIQENLDDLKARHLMLITNGDSAIGILKQYLAQSGKEIITIFGSRFEEDISDDYNYRMLSRIILCMERNCVLILRDLECIYGSLYDMLNQNYTVVGKRKNCRVALGAYSNPMCYVNDGFRCIVLVDYDEVDYSDPPFLNRFEKQLLRFSDVLNEKQEKIIRELESWVRQMSLIEELDEQFTESDMFMGFHEDTLPSLVLLHSNDSDESNEDILRKCKDDLMWIATPDGVLRTDKCERFKEDTGEVKMLAEEYFEKPIHNGLASFIKYAVDGQEGTFSAEGDVGSKIVLMTYATVHTDISQCFDDSRVTCQLERLGAYKSEKHLEDRIQSFFSSNKDLLVFQCKPELDGEHMLLARSIIEEKRDSYAKDYQDSNSTKQKKHICILVHVRRAAAENTVRWQFNFLCGWKQVFLDALDVPSIAVNEMRNETVNNLLTSSIWSFRGFAVKCILWCFNCIKYTEYQRQEASILNIAKNLFASENVIATIQTLVVRHVSPITDEVSRDAGESWQVKVACDLELLLNSSTLSSAMEQYLASLIRQPLAKIVYFLERENAWPPHLFFTEDDEYEEVWCDLLLDSSIFNIDDIPECLGAESYTVGGVRLDLRVPFSQVIFDGVNEARWQILEEYTKAKENEIGDESDLTESVRLEQLQLYAEILKTVSPSIHKLPEGCLSSYMADIFEITSSDYDSKIDNLQRISFSKCAFLSFARLWLPIEVEDSFQFYALLHLFVWTSKEKIIYLFDLIDCCQGLVNAKRLEEFADDFYSENEDILPFSKTNSEGNDPEDSGSSDSEDTDSDMSDSESSSSEDESDEDAKSTTSDDEEEEKCFEDRLVTLICEKMFPSERTVKNNDGLKSWIRNSSKLLFVANKVNNESPAYHFMRLCVDYGKMVLQVTGIPNDYIHTLKEIARELKPDYLDAENSLQILKKALIEPFEGELRGEEENYAKLKKFLSNLYSRCVETNAETESAGPIIEQVLSLDDEEMLPMIPVIYRLLFAEEDRSPGIFFDIIIDHRVDEEHGCLKDVDDVFKEHFLEGSIHHDSYPAVIICDLIQFIQNFDMHFNIEQLRSSDSKLLRLFRSATNVVTGDENSVGLVLLSSVAFLRAFYTMLSREPSNLNTETPYSHVMSEINSLLAVGGTRRSSMQLFFLKQLYGSGMNLFDLRKLCYGSDQLPVLKKQLENCKVANKAEFVSAYRLPEYEEVKAAFLDLTNKDESRMRTIIGKCQNSPSHRLALFGILLNTFYVKKAVGNLSDKEERLADWFSENSKDLPSPLKELMMRIIGRGKNFNHRGLYISLESSTIDIETALLILHISCVVVSHFEEESSPPLQYFLNPEKCLVNGMLAHDKEKRRGVFDQFKLFKEPSPVSCSCQLRIKYKDNQDKYTCPNCGNDIVNDHCDVSVSESSKMYFLESKSKEWEECTENMNASVYRALHLIVYACLYGGLATGISSNEAVTQLLHQHNEEFLPGRNGKETIDFCFNRVKADLECLMTILSCKRGTAVDVMNLVVEECTALLQGESFTDDISSPKEEILKWENKFTDIVEDVLPDALQSARPLKEKRMKFKDDQERSVIHKQLHELDEYPSDHNQQNEELKRLFRVTKQPSFTEVRSIFLHSPKDIQVQHSVLAIFLAKFQELPYLACLYPLIQWSRLVSTALTHHISRKEAKSKSINEFISGHLKSHGRNKEEQEELKKLFADFKTAWDRIREVMNDNCDGDEMPHLTDESCIGYCLSEGIMSIYLKKAIKFLQSIQNTTLDEMILTYLDTGHRALSFLKRDKNYCAIMSVSLREAKKQEIINFEWSEKFLKYAQNPEYGYGEEIDYDFEQIEKELADETLHGKCYLADSPTTFVFSKELFHSNAKMLTKIRELCPQTNSLPEDIRQGMSSLKDRKQDARNLLQHIEVVIYLLNMKSIPSEELKEMTMEKFAERWESKLPSPFPVSLLPDPKDSIQLNHIAALYEALEDLLVDARIEGLPKKFREKLTEETKVILNGLVDSRCGSLKLTKLLTALRRFVFRYLSSEQFLPDPHTSLRSNLIEPSLWSPDQTPSPDTIPEEIKLENIQAIIKHLEVRNQIFK